MSAIPMPRALLADEDGARDAFNEAVDAGEVCPDCQGRDIKTEVELRFPMFVCRTCNCHWPDPFAPQPILVKEAA